LCIKTANCSCKNEGTTVVGAITEVAVNLGKPLRKPQNANCTKKQGLPPVLLELLGVFSGKELFYTYPNGDMVSNVNIAYLCEDFTGDMLSQTYETTDLQWFRLDELPEKISPPVKPALRKCVEVLKERTEGKHDV